MDDLFKKFINTGVGFLSQGNKRIQTAIDKLVKESKLSEQEGKKIMDDLLKNGEAKRADLEKQFQGLADDLRTRVGLGAEPKKKAAPAAAPKAKAAAKPATSATAKAAGTVKKAADKVSDTADKAKRSAAAKAGAAKKKEAAAAASDAKE